MLSASPILPWEKSNKLCVLAAPHLAEWSERAKSFLLENGISEGVAFATSGSSGLPPKAIIFTHESLNICAAAAIQHMNAQKGDWCCPLPTWHVGGAMVHMRAALSGARVHTLPHRWNAKDYTDLLSTSQAAWSSLVPTQVIDLVKSELKAPKTIHCILVGGGALDTPTAQKARELGWPIVQSYGMTESGSQFATASPDEPWHSDKLAILPHWEAKVNDSGILAFQGKGKLSARLTTQLDGRFSLEIIPQNQWWQTNDIVSLEGNKLTFVRRADRLIKILGELVDPDAIQYEFARLAPDVIIEAVPHHRRGAKLIACTERYLTELEAISDTWNTTMPGPQRIERVVCYDSFPRNEMGKLDRAALRASLLELVCE